MANSFAGSADLAPLVCRSVGAVLGVGPGWGSLKRRCGPGTRIAALCCPPRRRRARPSAPSRRRKFKGHLGPGPDLSCVHHVAAGGPCPTAGRGSLLGPAQVAGPGLRRAAVRRGSAGGERTLQLSRTSGRPGCRPALCASRTLRGGALHLTVPAGSSIRPPPFALSSAKLPCRRALSG